MMRVELSTKFAIFSECSQNVREISLRPLDARHNLALLTCHEEEHFPGRGPEISRRLVRSRPNICQPWSHHKAQLNKTSLGSRDWWYLVIMIMWGDMVKGT